MLETVIVVVGMVILFGALSLVDWIQDRRDDRRVREQAQRPRLIPPNSRGSQPRIPANPNPPPRVKR